MLTRQKILLRLLYEFGNSLTRTRLFKLAFLLSEEGKTSLLKTFYEFVPYLYGPYSFTLNHELDNLKRDGLITAIDNGQINLSVSGVQAAKTVFEESLIKDLSLLKQEFGSLSPNSLVAFVYEKFPWYTINSTKTVKLKSEQVKGICANYTIGYQGHQVDGLLNVLLKQGIKKLVDTRLNPISRQYGFHKGTLSALCNKVGIEYTHIPELGVPSDWRQHLESEKDYSLLFERYESEILTQQKKIVDDLANMMTQIPSALMCMEYEHNHCHRSKLAFQVSKTNRLTIRELNEIV